MSEVDGAPPLGADDPWASLEADVLAWDGSAASAVALRKRLRALPERKGKPPTPGQGQLVRLAGHYRKREALGLTAAQKSEGRDIRAPFLGDPEMGAWDYEDALTIDDEAARGWLGVLEHPHLATPASRAVVLMSFLARRRDLWIPGARALVAQARADADARRDLTDRWKACFPSGLPKRWYSGGLLPEGAKEDRHHCRHMLVAACGYVAAGGPPEDLPGFNPESFASMPLPGDTADASAVLVALRFLAGGPLADVVARAVARFAPSAPPEAQSDRALEAAWEQMPAAREAITAALVEPRWRQAPRKRQLDGLHSWLLTAQWLAGRGEDEAIARMRAAAGDAALALAVALGEGPADPAARLLALLPVVFDPDVHDTTPDAIPLAAELLFLVRQPALQALPWAPLLRRAVGRERAGDPREGSVAEAAQAELALALVEREHFMDSIHREQEYHKEEVLRFAPKAAMATQVGVQMERLLRECHAEDRRRIAEARKERGGDTAPRVGELQVRLLWELLRADPPADAFANLLDALRGSATALHATVGALEGVDRVRNAGSATFLAAYRLLAEAAAGLVAQAGGAAQMRTVLAHLARWVTDSTGPGGGDDPAERLARGEALVVGGGAGLVTWVGSWGADASALALAWSRFSRSLAICLATSPPPEAPQLAEAEAALHQLDLVSAELAWPEGTILQPEIAFWRARLLRARELSNAAAGVTARVREQVAAGDVAGLRAAVVSGEFRLLRLAERRQVHLCLVRMIAFAEAKQIREEGLEQADVAAWSVPRLEAALAAENVAECKDVVNGPELRHLPAAEIRRAHEFLLERGEGECADRLRRAAGEGLGLPSAIAHRHRVALAERSLRRAIELASDPGVGELPAGSLSELHTFFLDHGEFGAADALRARVATTAALPDSAARELSNAWTTREREQSRAGELAGALVPRAAQRLSRSELGQLHALLLGLDNHQRADALLASVDDEETRRDLLSQKTAHAVSRDDERACVTLAESLRLEPNGALPIGHAEFRRLHLLLLDHWLLGPANALRDLLNVPPGSGEFAPDCGRLRKELPSRRRYLAPLLIGVSSGPILVIDFGLAFQSVLQRGQELEFVFTVLLCLCGTMGILVQQVRAPPEGGLRVRVLRALPVWILAFIPAFALSAVLLAILEASPEVEVAATMGGILKQTLLWACLAQFFGLFIGVVAQGNSVGNRGGGDRAD